LSCHSHLNSGQDPLVDPDSTVVQHPDAAVTRRSPNRPRLKLARDVVIGVSPVTAEAERLHPERFFGANGHAIAELRMALKSVP
jgi:hypothetical protein